MLLPNGSAGLVVSQGPGTLEVFDPARHTLLQAVKVGTNPHWLTVSPDGRTAYVSNEGSHDVSVVDVASRTVTATIPVGNAPRKLVVQPGTKGQGAMLPPAAPGHNPVTMADYGTVAVHGQPTVALEADDYAFQPTSLQGTPGQRLTVDLRNASGTLHNLSLPEQKLDVDVPPQGTVRVEVVFPPSGSVRFFCKFHEAMGMHGALHAGNVPQPTLTHGVGVAPALGAR